MCEEEFTNGYIGGIQRTFYDNGQIKTEHSIKYNRYHGLNSSVQ